jgi:hypothetical protein
MLCYMPSEVYLLVLVGCPHYVFSVGFPKIVIRHVHHNMILGHGTEAVAAVIRYSQDRPSEPQPMHFHIESRLEDEPSGVSRLHIVHLLVISS